jgi:NAD(P)H-dependent FMN reductase
MHKLMIITASTREARKGPAIARWIEEEARKDADWEVEPVDLKALALPPMDEPEHPRLRKYRHEHTKAWSAMVEPSDAFIAVIPEYNFSGPPALFNAFDYLFHEWSYKPMGLVSYGGVSAGTRSLMMVRQIVSALRMVPINDAVNLPFFTQFISPEGVFTPNEPAAAGAKAMFTELKRWTRALKAMRAEA